MNNLPMVIGQNNSDPGYIYLVRFNYFKNCYKIGSTKNVQSRLRGLSSQYGPTELIAYGFTNQRYRTEKFIQNLMFRSSNVKRYLYGGVNVALHDNVGPVLSTEHMIMETPTVCNVIVVIDNLCNSVQVGSPFEEFRYRGISSWWLRGEA
jgi:hypothetical protein